MSNWKLGDRVEISHRLNKQTWDPETHKKFTTNGLYSGATEKRWVPIPKKLQGVIVGRRTVQNNWVEHDYEYGSSAVPTKYISAYLVAYNLNKNPVHVLPEHMVRVP
ncbi:hypothetical protein ACIOJF_03635 [Glutamicibacter sp. NPDC087831]|uniref:hypothetical protein n=1 Tax=Glutamicibacter sp. NPDC087831 TaxID=3363998 RepID=UPI003828B797